MFSFLKPKDLQRNSFSFLKEEPVLSDLPSVIRFKQVARRALIGAAVGAAIEFEESEQKGGRQGPQGRKRKEAPFSWEDHVARLNEQEFQLRYRLSKAAFYELLESLRNDLLQRNIKQAKNSKGVECTPQLYINVFSE